MLGFKFIQFSKGVPITYILIINTLRPRQNGCHFPGDILKCIFFNGNVGMLIKILVQFVPEGSIDNIPALVQITALRRSGDKPLSEPIMSLGLNELNWTVIGSGYGLSPAQHQTKTQPTLSYCSSFRNILQQTLTKKKSVGGIQSSVII